MRKDVSGVLAFLAGAALATGVTLLLTTDKGEELRSKVAAWLKEKGIMLKETELDELMGRIWSRGKQEAEPAMPDEPSLGE
ncbi:MAG: YtxH domain-containing protein [Bacteroidota bacterium]|uniref:YtxH domain-containing protein n=1 Tax=Parabacteroides sp. FAFU027 TaxID=2922715 RepID=UPI001FAF5DDA|nr:YtxH domain-containing protein [Parabacteroides sp. FAFU027]MDP4269534.1 YtxH domain-containing protein [Bacteroidota bacterium]